MGIKGIYKELGPGQRISMCKLAVDHVATHKRPLRLAIDISIWQFQLQAKARGGANPAVRTLFYRLLRLLGLGILAVFVFDGPRRPEWKRGKKSGGGARGDMVADAMARRMVRLFGFMAHDAPGEAEAECALLQREGLVDAVLSEDVDTIMFGCGRTLRGWTSDVGSSSSSSMSTSKPPTHVSVYEGEVKLDRKAMVLVALMSGGDYLPEGVPGCGVKVACEAARAGFGTELCSLKLRDDGDELAGWRQRLRHELSTNESHFFQTRHKAIANAVADDFPSVEILRNYTHPIVSSAAAVERLRAKIDEGALHAAVDVAGLRTFVHETFDWSGREGAINLVRKLAPKLLVRRLMAKGDQATASLVRNVTKSRQHMSTDGILELRVEFVPADVVGLNLQEESLHVVTGAYGRDGLALNHHDEVGLDGEEEENSKGPKKPFDPSQPQLDWIPEFLVRRGAPSAVEKWEQSKKSKPKTKTRTKKKKGQEEEEKEKDDGKPQSTLDEWVRSSQDNKAASKTASPQKSSTRTKTRPRSPLLFRNARLTKHAAPVPAPASTTKPAEKHQGHAGQPIIIASSPDSSSPPRKRHPRSPPPVNDTPAPSTRTRDNKLTKTPSCPPPVLPTPRARPFKRCKSGADGDGTAASKAWTQTALDGWLTSSPPIAAKEQSSTRDTLITLIDHDNDHANDHDHDHHRPPARPASAPPIEPSPPRRDAKSTTTLYMRTGLQGYFHEVEMKREEADAIMTQERKIGARGVRRQVWRRSDMCVLDLTGED